MRQRVWESFRCGVFLHHPHPSFYCHGRSPQCPDRHLISLLGMLNELKLANHFIFNISSKILTPTKSRISQHRFHRAFQKMLLNRLCSIILDLIPTKSRIFLRRFHRAFQKMSLNRLCSIIL